MLYLDTETYCELPLKKHGTHRYAEEVEITVCAWAIDDEDVDVWDCTDGSPMPPRLRAALDNHLIEIVMHNGGPFDATVMRHAWGIDIHPERIQDTMAIALAHSLPGGLGKLCEVLRVPLADAKQDIGKNLILLFCQPRPKKQKIRRANRFTHPDEWEAFLKYAGHDVTAMRQVYKRLPKWNWFPFERGIWQLDQKINNRGVRVDIDLATKALEAMAEIQAGNREAVQDMTDGDVESATQRDRLISYLNETYDLNITIFDAPAIEKLLEDDIDDGAKELLRLRLDSSATSTAKYQRLVDGVSTDGRLRGLLQYCGASRTGRWGGRFWQPQNLPRPDMKGEQVDLGIEALKNETLLIAEPQPTRIIKNATRGSIIASEGKVLAVSDLSNIEGRVAAWIAGEDWKLDAFRAYDRGEGPDLYIAAYAKSFQVPTDSVDKKQRQIGKVQELALQYEGGVGAFVTFAMVYRLDLDELADVAWPVIPEHVKDQASANLNWAKKSKRSMLGLSERTWLVCEALKLLWRAAHPAIGGYWKPLQQACVKAVEDKAVTTVGKLTVQMRGNWLTIRLPSGRSLCYPGAEVSEKGVLSYYGVHQYTRRWQKLSTYGGKLFENATQAGARDVMAANMPRIENAGYDILLSVHDELITETEDTGQPVDNKLSLLLATAPHWAPDLPLSAGGFTALRYRKDD